MLASCGVARIVTVAPEPVPVVAATPTTTVVVAQPVQTQPTVVVTQPVSTTVTYPRTHTTRTTTIDVTPLTSDISLHLDLQAVAAAFAQANTVEEFEMILNSNSYIISNLDLNHDGYIDYLRVLETIEGRNHVMLIQAVLAANIYQDVATLVVEMGYSTPYVQVIGAPYIYGTKYIIEPVFYKRPPLFDRFGRPTYAYWRSPYYWDHFPKHYSHHAPYHLGHYQAYVTTFMENHHYCHNVHYVDHYHYSNYETVSRPVSRTDYAQQHPDQSFSSRTTATYIPSGSTTATRVTNTRQLREAVEQSGATRTTTVTRSTATATRTSTSATTNAATPQPATSATTGTPTAQPATATRTSATSTRTSATSTRTSATSTRTSATGTSAATRNNSATSTTRQAQTTVDSPRSDSNTTTTRVRTSGTTSTTRSATSTRGTTTRSSSATTSSRSTTTGTRSSGSNAGTRSTTDRTTTSTRR